jgi:hypothetical protein
MLKPPKPCNKLASGGRRAPPQRVCYLTSGIARAFVKSDLNLMWAQAFANKDDLARMAGRWRASF